MLRDVMKLQSMMTRMVPHFEQVCSLLNIPGMAASLITPSHRVFFNSGYTSEQLNRRAVDELSQFRVGSITKSFWSTALKALLGEQYAATNFAVAADEGALKELSVQEILNHTTGLSTLSGAMSAFLGLPLSSASLRYSSYDSHKKGCFQYNNIAYKVLADLITDVAKCDWRDYLRDTVFLPLNLLQTGFDKPKTDNLALPHAAWDDMNYLLTDEPFADGLSPAAGIYSNVTDLTVWLQHQMLNYHDEPLSVVIPLPKIKDSLDDRLARQAYAEGRFFRFYREPQTVVVSLLGGVPGYSALAAFSPEYQIGMVLLANKMNLVRVFEFLFYELIRDAAGLESDLLLTDLDRQRKSYSEQLAKQVNFEQSVILQQSLDFVIEDKKYGAVRVFSCDGQCYLKFLHVDKQYHLLFDRHKGVYCIDTSVLEGQEAWVLIFPRIEVNIENNSLSWTIYQSDCRGGLITLERHRFGHG